MRQNLSDQIENANIVKKFYSELAPNPVKKLPVVPNKYNRDTTKDYYTDIFKN